MVLTHPGTGIIQHDKDDEDVGILGSLDRCQDSVFAFEEKASSIRNYEEELRSLCRSHTLEEEEKEENSFLTIGNHLWAL